MTVNFTIYLDAEILRTKPVWEREEIVARELATVEKEMYAYVRDLQYRGY